MSRFGVLALCLQACLLQTVFSQQCGYNQISYSPSNVGISVGAPSASGASYAASYGGVGTGQVGVTGDILASGKTSVVGSVPVLGSVEFGGKVQAAGSVSISGQCGCGCN